MRGHCRASGGDLRHLRRRPLPTLRHRLAAALLYAIAHDEPAPLADRYPILPSDPTQTAAVARARDGGSYIIPAGDEGGALTSGAVHPGTIDLCDIDLWTFQADALDSIAALARDFGTDALIGAADEIIEANAKDIEAAPGYGLSDAAIDRLRLDQKRIDTRMRLRQATSSA